MKTYSRQPNVLITGLDRLCRLCLNRINPKDLLPVFNEEMLPDIQMKIVTCLGFEVKPEESLPNMICVNCCNEVERFYIFKKKCQITHQTLKARLKVPTNMKQNVDLVAAESDNLIIEAKPNNTSFTNLNVVCNSINVPETSVVMHSTVDAIAKPIVEETVSVCVIENTHNNNQVVPFNNEKSVADIVHEEIVPAETSAVNNIQVQNQEDCEENMCSILAEKLINAGVLEVDGDTLNLSRTQKGMLELEMADGTVVTFQIQEESESEQEEAITVSLPSECVRWAQPMLYECLQCHQRFERRHSYLKHLERHQKEDKPKWCCVICGKQFPSRSALARHRRVHSGERPYHCEHCPRAFAQKEVLVRHSALHAEQKPFTCSQCPKSFTQRMGLVMHERSHAPPGARPLHLHRCPVCPKVFLYASGLSRHQAVHDGRGFVCPECCRMFIDKSSLRRHRQNAH